MTPSACPSRERLSAYADGELPPGEAALIESHLAVCRACGVELADLRAVREVFSPFARTAPAWPDEVRRRAHARIDDLIEQQEQLPLLRIARMLSGVAACVLVAAGLWLGAAPQPAQQTSRGFERTPWERTAITQAVGNDRASVEAVEDAAATPEWIVADLSAGK